MICQQEFTSPRYNYCYREVTECAARLTRSARLIFKSIRTVIDAGLSRGTVIGRVSSSDTAFRRIINQARFPSKRNRLRSVRCVWMETGLQTKGTFHPAASIRVTVMTVVTLHTQTRVYCRSGSPEEAELK